MSIYTVSLRHQSLYSGGQTERHPTKHGKYDYQTLHFTRNWQSTWEEKAGEAKRRHGLSRVVFSAIPFRAAEDPKPCSLTDTEEAQGSAKSNAHFSSPWGKPERSQTGLESRLEGTTQSLQKRGFSRKGCLVFKDHFSWLSWCYDSGSALHTKPPKQNTAALYSLKASQHSGFHTCLPDKEGM